MSKQVKLNGYFNMRNSHLEIYRNLMIIDRRQIRLSTSLEVIHRLNTITLNHTKETIQR